MGGHGVSALKHCNGCGRDLPATSECFTRDNSRHDGLFPRCRDCKNERQRKLAAGNIERYREYARRSYARHREKRLAAVRTAHERNPQPCRDRVRRWRKDNADAYRAWHASYRKRNREVLRERGRVASSRRRARELAATGSHERGDIEAQYERQRGRCYWCGKKVGDDYHVDHVTPLALGGTNGPENIVVACPHCNLSKSAKHPMDFAGVMF